MSFEANEDLNSRTTVLGTGSSASIFISSNFLLKIVRISKPLKLLTIRGDTKSCMIVLCKNLEVWFNPNSMFSIISAPHAVSKSRVEMGSSKEKTIFVRVEENVGLNFVLSA